MIFDEKSLEERKYTMIRKKSAILATSRPYTVAMIIITLMYAIEALVYLIFEELIKESIGALETFLLAESVLLGLFCLDIIINIIAFRRRYF